MIIASGKIGTAVMLGVCQHNLDGSVMPGQWESSAVVPILKRNGGVLNCGSEGSEACGNGA